MFEFIKSKVIRIYDQSLEYFTRNGCTGYTLFGIISDMYGPVFKNKEVEEFLKNAERDKKWWQAWGARFDQIYQYFTDRVYLKTGIRLKVEVVNIYSDKFEEMVKQGYSFGLGLKHANNAYKKAIEDGKLTEEDLKLIKASPAKYMHNHRFRYGQIIESYKYKFNDNTIDLSIKALRAAVSLGIYYSNARTLIPVDTMFNRLVVKYLQDFKIAADKNKDNYYTENMTNLKGIEKNAFKRAAKIYFLHR